MGLSAGAILLGLRVLGKGKVSARQVAGYFRELAAGGQQDQVLALNERLARDIPDLMERVAKLSVQSAFVPIHCADCGTSFRAHAWQISAAVACPVCDAALIVPRHVLDSTAQNRRARRAAEAPVEYWTCGAANRFAHFELLSQVGAGGAGKVYEALNRRSGRKVALKVLRFLPLEPRRASWRRLLREASLAGSVSHPHIVKVHEIGLAEGVPFVEMEFLPAGSVKDLVEREGPMLWQDACRVVSEALSALCQAHKEQVIHRDLKPGNILLDGQGHAKLTDFGLCKLLEETTTTRVVGSPHFMAPEQWTGSQVGPWTDIYAVGLSLYFLITAHLPFEGENALSLMYKHLHFPVPDASQWAPNVPLPLLELIRKATAKEPSQRFGSAEEFRTALAVFL